MMYYYFFIPTSTGRSKIFFRSLEYKYHMQVLARKAADVTDTLATGRDILPFLYIQLACNLHGLFMLSNYAFSRDCLVDSASQSQYLLLLAYYIFNKRVSL